MSASPDITQGPPPPSSEQQRRSARRKNQGPAASSADQDSTSPGQLNLSGSTSIPDGPAENSRGGRGGRGRGRGRGAGSRKTVESSPVSQDSGGNAASMSGSSNESQTYTVSQQPKRRGRKPKQAKEAPEMMETDPQQPSAVDSEEHSMDLGPDSAEALTFNVTKLLTGVDANAPTPMDSGQDQGVASQSATATSLFSSVLKSEPSFGLQSGGGIPGLDLDDCEANSATFNVEPVVSTAVPLINISFRSNPGVEEECKSFQELQITKPEEKSKPSSSPPKEIKKEEETAAAPANTEEGDSSKVRRSSRIKTLEEQRGSRGRRREVVTSLSDSSGLNRSSLSLHEDDSNSNSSISMQTSSGYSSPTREGGMVNSSSAPNLTSFTGGISSGEGAKPYKVKQRWRNSLDAESVKSYGGESSASSMDTGLASSVVESLIPSDKLVKRRGHLAFDGTDDELLEKLKKFEGIDESIYRTERKISKENKGMVCDCYLSKDEISQGEVGCTEDCLNRLLMVECGNKCPTGNFCSNKRFQRKEYAPLEVFKTEKKGHGLRTLKAIPEGGFVIEYVGEVLDVNQFERRTTEYAKGNQEHFYFMALKSDAIIDATLRGNCSRFINHSCEPNCETQKWTVNGEVRIGFFAIADLQPGDEITFDYQFQRYGKKAQKCFCMTESCRGWIGEVEDDEAEDDKTEDKEEPAADAELETEVEESKAKVKPKVEKKKRKNVQLEDMAFREELLKLEASGLKNRTHTLTLSRLMVRAESWDDRERMLKILINGDTPCRRLFLDYHGLRLIWSWMVDLPLPHESDGPQLIRNDVYHMLFLRALQSLPIPNKSMLLESKVLSLVEKWSSVPSVTTTITLVKRSDQPAAETKKSDAPENTSSGNDSLEKMDTSEVKEEPSSTADGMQEVVEERVWNFVPVSKTLLESWSDLKEVFRIPKKERVEQMKEHEREADKGTHGVSSLTNPGFSSYDRDHRNKQFRSNRERRVPVLDSSQPQFHRDRYSNRMVVPAGVSKEQWRKRFEESIRVREQQEFMRKQQDALVTLHQERCALVGLDPATTPIVDPHGVYYLDPKTVEWKHINNDDPTMPPELIKFVQLSQYPPTSELIEPPVEPAVEPEQAFPPWPTGLPPPPPLPPRELPKNWKMAVDDEGRCYYYHLKTRVTQWHPPLPDDVSSTESSESSSEEEVEETVAEGSPTIVKSGIQTWRTKLNERANKRKKSGLVQERIISPRGDDDKGFSKEMVKENKKKALAEKLARLKVRDSTSENESEVASEADGDATIETTADETADPVVKLEKKEHKRKPRVSMKKTRREKPRGPKDVPPKPKEKPSEESEENLESSSPIETELDLTLSQLDEENDGFFSRVSAGPSRIIGSTPSMDVLGPVIPGLGFDSRDLEAKKKADRAARHAAKKKALAQQKKSKEKAVVEASSSSNSAVPTDKRVSSKEASSKKDAFRNSIATIVVAHLNPYRKSEHIKTTEDFKHLARKITHAILLKELKHTRDVTSLEVTDSVKHKTKEYIKKFMARFPNGVYVRSPENTQNK